MPITTVSSRQFNQHASEVKRASLSGPVFITDRGKPSHVLLTMADYRRLNSAHAGIAELLACDDSADLDTALNDHASALPTKGLAMAADLD